MIAYGLDPLRKSSLCIDRVQSLFHQVLNDFQVVQIHGDWHAFTAMG